MKKTSLRLLILTAAVMTAAVCSAQDLAPPPIVIQSNQYVAPNATWDHERAARQAATNSTTVLQSVQSGATANATTNSTGSNVSPNASMSAQPGTMVMGGQPPCAAQTPSWSANGVTCNAPTPLLVSGTSTSVTDGSAPTTGNATFTCASGTLSVQPGASCASTCAGGSTSWVSGSATCAASAPALGPGGSYALGSTNGSTGTANLYCQPSGVMQITSSNCVAPAPIVYIFYFSTGTSEFKGRVSPSFALVPYGTTSAPSGPIANNGFAIYTLNGYFEVPIQGWGNIDYMGYAMSTYRVRQTYSTIWYDRCSLEQRYYGGATWQGVKCQQQ